MACSFNNENIRNAFAFSLADSGNLFKTEFNKYSLYEAMWQNENEQGFWSH